jgi:Ras-related protein Rab-2A
MSSPAHVFKFIMVCNSAVGKSCLLLRFDEDRFQPIHDVTVGVTFSIKLVQIEGQEVKIQIWDTAGQEIFRSITRSYYRDSHCAIIVYDITDANSFDKVEEWIRDVRNLAPSDCVLVLFGNKLDLDAQRVITRDQGQDLAQRNGLLFFETSAATGANVAQAFNECVTAVYFRARTSGLDSTRGRIAIKPKPKQEDRTCPC